MKNTNPGSLRVAIRAPGYFPVLEYFRLMLAADIFVIADTFQYSRQSFHNRTRIRNPDGWQWMTIPLLGGQHGTPISEIRIGRDRGSWRRAHLRALEFNYRSSPYFEYLEAEVRSVIETQSDYLSVYTTESVRCIQEILELPTNLVLASELDGAPRSFQAIVNRLAADTVVVSPDASATDRSAAREALVVGRLSRTYRQNFPGYESEMSALDAIFNLGPAGCRRLIESVEISGGKSATTKGQAGHSF